METPDVVAILERVHRLGRDGDAKLVGVLSVLAPTVLLDAIERLEAQQREDGS